MYEDRIPPKLALNQWIRFHRAVSRCRADVCIADFADVITDFGRVIAQVNQRFETAFGVFEHTHEREEECFRLIEARTMRAHGVIVESLVPRPSSERQVTGERIRAALAAPELVDRRETARDLYRDLTQPSPPKTM
jgi:hypothetical protein